MQTHRMPTPEEQKAEAQHVLDVLNRWDKKFDGRHREKRSNRRMSYSAEMRFYRRKSHLSPGEVDSGTVVFARNISQTGVAFLYKGRFQTKRGTLCLDPDAGATAWFHVEIVRARLVHDDFWDYGAKFIRRADPEEISVSVDGAKKSKPANAVNS